MNIDLLLALLKNTTSGSASMNFLSKETRMPIRIIKQNIHRLAKNNLVMTIEKEEIKIPEGQRLKLAVFALKEGADVERVCRALGWKDFEDLAALALEHHGCRVKKHFRFKGSKRRYEIDVIGLKEPLMLSVECKRWRRSWRRAATINAIQMQVERTKALAQYLPEPKSSGNVSDL